MSNRQMQAEMPIGSTSLKRPDGEVAFVRLSLIHVNGKNQALFVKAPKRSVFFEPGCRRVPGLKDEAALAEKIWRDLQVALIPDSVEFLFSFKAQAFGPNRSAMMENRCFGAQFVGKPQLTKYVAEIRYLGTLGKQFTSPAGITSIDQLFSRGVIW